MKERPVLLSAPMVRALLAGTKTQTRRIVKVQPSDPRVGGACSYDEHGQWVWLNGNDGSIFSRMGCCPYGQPGDRLWVREAWAHARHADANCAEDGPFVYAADGEFAARERLNPRWVPGIHMFRWASRITLEITEVRVERLQDISEADALAEGILHLPRLGGFGLPDGEHFHATDPRISYWSLWDAINGAGSVEANPWVWAVSFRRIQDQTP